jgi:single-strand DNA-binding protein
MPKSINRVTLIGNCGKDPEVKFLASGSAVANFSLATSERFKDKSGEWQDKTEWHSLTAYGKTAEIIRDYVKKGTKLYVEGRLQTRSWDQDGQKRYKTEIIVGELVLLGGKPGNDDRDGEPAWGVTRGNVAEAPRGPGYDSTEITDDDIPF